MTVSVDSPAEGTPVATDDRIFGPKFRSLTFGIVALVLLVAFEAMAVTTAMPVAVRELDGLSLYAWGFSGFMVASLFATVVAGGIADRRGPVAPFLGGVTLFTGGLILAGLAPTMLLFLLGRAVQGLGGGAVVVALFVIVGRAYPAHVRPRVFAVISSAWVLPSIVGPLVAGTVSEHASWRWVFLGLVPLVLGPLLVMLPRLRHLPNVEPSTPQRGRNWLALAAAVGIGLLQWAGQELQWFSLLAVAVGLAALIVSLPKLLPPGTLRFRRGLPTVVAMRGLLAGGFFGSQAFVPLMLIEHRGLSTTVAGLTLTVGALGWSSGSFWQGRPSLRTPRHQLVRFGALFVASGTAVVALAVFTTVPVWLAAVGCAIAGLGMGLSLASLSVLLLDISPVEQQGVNTAAAQMSDSLGNVIFIGLGGVLFAFLHERVDAVATFLPIFVVMILVGLGALAASTRVRTDRS
ncbi:MFS transporter [Tenggerimyces flavus]|uniref:MFS transporter n=1 Tax=Tenggerimyces flavus TaxID=1708749 RepID=A0ABV7YAJ5_9ACTN|nr:MFS transporter [Tenggerimyces flavus]MBM7789014.1 MFS family permease [Tenggerimyces flavus]